MRHRSSLPSRNLSVIVLFIISALFVRLAPQSVSAQTGATIQTLEGNGIFVKSPRVYDDFSLRIMLNAARARLASLQVLDQSALVSRIGAVTGATLTQSAIAAQVLGPSLPQTAVTSNGATGSTSTVTSGSATQVAGQAPTGPTSSTTNVTGTQTTVNQGLPVQNIVTTSPQMVAAPPALPQTGGFTAPSNFSISSLDALDEEMQLSYEIANLELLLEGSLSDRYVRGQRLVKPRTTMGFEITISPQAPYKDAVAVVDVELEPPANSNFSGEPPAITSLLPREKTYNVAAITDKTVSIGGGFVSSVINGGLTVLHGRKTFYIVKDQDTLAMPHESGGSLKAAFAWQFKPVLGQRYVRPGMRETFVQIANAIPDAVNAGCFGKVKVATYWRRYDRKNGILKDVINESIRTGVFQTIPRFDLTPVIGELDYEDLGGGMVLTKIKGLGQGSFGYLSGTYVRVGANYYREGSPGFTYEDTQIRFVAPASDIARYKAYIVSRDGREMEILDPRDPQRLALIQPSCDQPPPALPAAPVQVPPDMEIEIAAFDDNNSVFTARLRNMPQEPDIEDYMIIIGGRVFGLSDAPINREKNGTRAVLRAVVLNSLLLSGTKVQVKPLYWKEGYGASKLLEAFHVESSPDRITTLTQTPNGTVFLLYGNRLTHASIIYPERVNLETFDGFNGSDTLRKFTLSSEQLKTVKQIVLQKSPGERPMFLSLPSPDKDADKKASLTANERVTVGTDEAVITGDNLDKLKAVRFKGKEIRFSLSADKKSVTIAGLVDAGVTVIPVQREIEFEFEGKKKVTLKLDVVNSKVELVNRDKQ